MPEWFDAYAATDDPNEQYGVLREEMARLRGRRDDIEFYEPDAVKQDVRRLNETVDGDLVVFTANDFGLPKAFRPDGVSREVQNEIRAAVLEHKYDDSNEALADVRRELLDAHPGIHKALVAVRDDDIRYFLPEGSTGGTNFLTAREMVGLVDYTTNSAQADSQSVTY